MLNPDFGTHFSTTTAAAAYILARRPLNLRNPGGLTPLHFAAQRRDAAV
jgi:hypothetical protein